MFWVNILHIYQPPMQYPEIIGKVVRECYTPLLALLAKYPQVKTVININGSLTEQLAAGGYDEVIKRLSELVSLGTVELTGSACYHPILPKIPEAEIVRQIKLNEEINQRYFGNSYKPKGFFPPELGYSAKVGRIIKELGYEWAVVDETGMVVGANHDSPVPDAYLSKDQRTGLDLLIRDNNVSSRIAFEDIDTVTEMVDAAKRIGNGILVTAMDGETYGHHREGQFYFLEKLLTCLSADNSCAFIKTITGTEAVKMMEGREEIEITDSTWVGKGFPLWENPENKTQSLEWKFMNFVLETVGKNKFAGSAFWNWARDLADKALNSDQFYWASQKPYWNYYMIEKAAGLGRDAILALPLNEKEKEKAENYYDMIIKAARNQGGETVVTF